MANGKEKRRTDRYSLETPILCSYFNMPVRASAKTINFSRDGMFIVSEMAFHPGSPVLIQARNIEKLQNFPENTEGLRQTTLAEVRWCRRISEKPSHYHIGVKYYESWY